MFAKPVIYLLAILLASSHGRVATQDKTILDVSSNTITGHVKHDNSTMLDVSSNTITGDVKHDNSTILDVSSNTITGDGKDDNSTIPDESSNTITGVVKHENSTIIVDLPTVSPPDENATVTDSEFEFNITLVDNCKNEIAENAIDSNEEPCKVREPEPPLILTRYIKENRLTEARNASRVNPELFLGLESYSGYFTVNETYDSNVFFWYFPVEKKEVEKTPWIVWLQGGPGASSMTGLFDEIGPFQYNISEGLVRNEYTWLLNHSLLFIDQPVGTGFSFTRHDDGYARDMDTYGDHMYSMLRQFLLVFPELRAAPLYVAGESYGGKYVPALAIRIHRHRATPGGEANLQGLITGNGYVEPPMISQLERPFSYFGLLEPEQLEMIQPLIDSLKKAVRENRSVDAKTKWNTLLALMLIMTNQKQAYNFLKDELPLGRYLHFLQKPEIKQALHVGDNECSYANMTVNRRLEGDFLSSARGLYEELLEHYRVLTYCGQLDLMLPCVVTSEAYRAWAWGGAGAFRAAPRQPFMYRDKLAGYHKSGGHLTEVVLRGAGHMAPLDAPAPARALVTRWTRRLPLGRAFYPPDAVVLEYVRNHTALLQPL